MPVIVTKWREWLTLCVGLAGLYTAAAQAATVDPTSPVKTHLSSPRGVLSLSNSRQGGAVLDAGNLAPGGSVTGSVTVVARGARRAALMLTADNVHGQGRGDLANALQLRVEDMGGGGAVVFDGPLGTLHRVPLGAIVKGRQRSYRFTARLPEDVGDDYAGASVSTDFVWSASLRRA